MTQELSKKRKTWGIYFDFPMYAVEVDGLLQEMRYMLGGYKRNMFVDEVRWPYQYYALVGDGYVNITKTLRHPDCVYPIMFNFPLYARESFGKLVPVSSPLANMRMGAHGTKPSVQGLLRKSRTGYFPIPEGPSLYSQEGQDMIKQENINKAQLVLDDVLQKSMRR